MDLLERIATKDYEKLSKEIRAKYTLDDFIKKVKEYQRKGENKKWQD